MRFSHFLRLTQDSKIKTKLENHRSRRQKKYEKGAKKDFWEKTREYMRGKESFKRENGDVEPCPSSPQAPSILFSSGLLSTTNI